MVQNKACQGHKPWGGETIEIATDSECEGNTQETLWLWHKESKAPPASQKLLPRPPATNVLFEKKKEHSRKFKNTTIHIMICAYVCFGKDIPHGVGRVTILHTHICLVIFLYCRNQPVTRLLPELFVLLKGDSKRNAFFSFTFLLLFCGVFSCTLHLAFYEFVVVSKWHFVLSHKLRKQTICHGTIIELIAS